MILAFWRRLGIRIWYVGFLFGEFLLFGWLGGGREGVWKGGFGGGFWKERREEEAWREWREEEGAPPFEWLGLHVDLER